MTPSTYDSCSRNGFAGVEAAIQRWSGVGPYYAMMPTSFALEQIQVFTKSGDAVLDPFCGRGTIPFAAAALNRPFWGLRFSQLVAFSQPPNVNLLAKVAC